MIGNTEVLYKRAKEYQDKRAAIVSTYENRMKALEDAKGSKYFTDESKKAEDTRDEALKALKGEYGEYFNISLKAMQKANESRAMTPPTEEELRTLQLLKMKETLTEADLQAAANTLKGNATCLSILTEMAHGKGIMRNYISYSETKEMPVEEVNGAIKGLASSLRDFMDYDTTKAGRIAQEHHAQQYGLVGNTPLRKRPLFDTMADCYEELTGMAGDTLTAFCKAVDE